MRRVSDLAAASFGGCILTQGHRAKMSKEHNCAPGCPGHGSLPAVKLISVQGCQVARVLASWPVSVTQLCIPLVLAKHEPA